MSALVVLPPGSTIGVIGGGQLGRMLVIAARQMGYRAIVLDPQEDCPAGQVANRVIVAPYSNTSAAAELARASDVVTYEFENIPAATVEAAETVGRVYPDSRVLRICQDRLLEKQAAKASGHGTAEFMPVRSAAELRAAVQAVGLPAVMKTSTMGYDGKGQQVVKTAAEADDALKRLRGMADTLIFERLVPFKKELSVICARNQAGNKLCFPPTENVHKNNILDISIAPARVSPETAAGARRVAADIADHLGVVGLLCVEMFLTAEGRILVNELAPRPHNSGHWTIEACATSQFQQLVRVLCGLPLGAVNVYEPAVMVNLLGETWLAHARKPDFSKALAISGVSLHIYGKPEARTGRKMGHLTAVAGNVDMALSRALEARDRLLH